MKHADLKQAYPFTSHLAVFENCAEQYRFLRALEFAPARTSPILFGTLVHQTIATFDEVVGRIERHNYAIPERPVKLCRECDMRHYCDAKTWSFRRPR